MTSFGEFYQQGGAFMHAISLVTLVAGSVLVGRLLHTARRKPGTAAAAAGLTGSLLVLSILCGVLGTGFGFTEMCGAITTVPTDAWPQVTVRALPMALAPTLWSLMLAIPLWLVHAVTKFAEQRG